MSLKINRICLNCSLAAAFLLLLQTVSAQYDFSAADQLLQRNQKALGNYVTALVWKDGKPVYQKELGTDFNAKTQAPIGHCSQWLTAAIVMSFVDQGKLSLDDPVGKYIPIFNSYMKGYVTIRHCLSHVTGIENDRGFMAKLVQRKKYPSLEAEVNAIAAKEISNNTGKEFHYGNYGPTIAARVVEIVGKKNFERLATERIFRPLKMRSTTFDNNGEAPNPSFGALSTANDYLNFLIMVLNKGMFEGKRVLSEESIAEMQKPQFTGLPNKFTPKMAEGFEYGLGEWIQEKDASGNSTVIGCPGFSGTWPYIDKCRGYAAIIFTKDLNDNARKDVVMQFKEIIEGQIVCK